MRGILNLSNPFAVLQRISPAHAGNTAGPSEAQRAPEDQPRTCGEYAATARVLTCRPGSAPHMRGIPGSTRKPDPDAGISPAHAGNTPPTRRSSPRRPDQPRTCGEYQPSGSRPRPKCGSAPHMRGIRWRGLRGGRCRRISPAHAGNTMARATRRAMPADQPRTCGEYAPELVAVHAGSGSAPHMRGIPPGPAVPGSHLRISPAHAGNTFVFEGVVEHGGGSAPHMRGIRLTRPRRWRG